MNLEQFCTWLDHLGSDITQWPTGARDSAQELLANSPEARAHHFAQQQMDAIFEKLPMAQPSETLLDRIMNRIHS